MPRVVAAAAFSAHAPQRRCLSFHAAASPSRSIFARGSAAERYIACPPQFALFRTTRRQRPEAGAAQRGTRRHCRASAQPAQAARAAPRRRHGVSPLCRYRSPRAAHPRSMRWREACWRCRWRPPHSPRRRFTLYAVEMPEQPHGAATIFDKAPIAFARFDKHAAAAVNARARGRYAPR